jgi:predicted nucleic acid-binding Zn ribbon protein
MDKRRNKSKGEIQPVAEAIRQLLNSYQLTSKFDEASLINSWERLVGKPIAKRTKKVYIRNKVLFVEFDSSSMKHDFVIHKTKVLDLLKKEFGDQVVTEIIIM